MNQEEVFKDIPNYEGMYQVSNLGNVKSLRFGKERILKAGIDSVGYLITVLCNAGVRKTVKVHQLVAIVFLNHKTCGYKLVVDHINDVKTDNRVDNLQIVTHRFNICKTQGKYTSKYKGVSWVKRDKRWLATVRINGKRNHLGNFKCELAASYAYQKAIKQLEK